jgi:hypothetical protein
MESSSKHKLVLDKEENRSKSSSSSSSSDEQSELDSSLSDRDFDEDEISLKTSEARRELPHAPSEPRSITGLSSKSFATPKFSFAVKAAARKGFDSGAMDTSNNWLERREDSVAVTS